MLRFAAKLALGSFAWVLAACGDPCDDLAKVCADCADKTYGASCDAVVAKGNASVCSSDVAVFRAACPAPLTTSSTGASTSTASTASAGGQSGQGGGK
jgi:hypothetical protein